MERRNLALLCAGVVCFWLFALAFGTAQGKGLRIQPAVQTQAEPAAQTLTVTPPQLTLPCRAAILIDQTSGAVLYEMNADRTMPIASITKVMTLLLTFEAVHAGRLTMDTAVPVSEHAYHMGGSQIWLEPGEQFTLDEMLKAICVSSANDAAVAVAELVGGSEPAFVQQMNARAAELGIRFVLDPASELRGDGQYLPASSLITILGNLTENAFDALRSAPENAQKEVTVSIREGEHGMLLSVDDSGAGMAAPQLDRIFERGFSTKGEGRGTGLSLVKETVDAFGGTIRVESEPGIGSSFIITFSDAESRAQT